MNNLVHFYSNGFWLASFALILWHFSGTEGLIKLFQFLFVIGISVTRFPFPSPQISGPETGDPLQGHADDG
jgi:hypothetical protein